MNKNKPIFKLAQRGKELVKGIDKDDVRVAKNLAEKIFSDYLKELKKEKLSS